MVSHTWVVKCWKRFSGSSTGFPQSKCMKSCRVVVSVRDTESSIYYSILDVCHPGWKWGTSVSQGGPCRRHSSNWCWITSVSLEFQIWRVEWFDEGTGRCENVRKSDSRLYSDTYCPSRYHGLIREKSVSCDSFGSLLRCEKTNYMTVRIFLLTSKAWRTLTCSQFCIVSVSIWSTITISIEDR